MPAAVVIPELAYRDAHEATQWLCRAFGFVERLRIGNHRAQLSFGDGAVIVTELAQQSTINESLARQNADHALMVRVSDLQTHYQAANQAGARIISPPTEYPYGEKQYTAEDLGGHRWTFSQTVADVDPRSWGGTVIEWPVA